MGTRNLTCVQLSGEYRVAQYGQWDGYPDVQGITILTFLRDEMNREKFIANLSQCFVPTEEQRNAWWKEVGHDISKSNGWVSYDLSNKFKELHPTIDRDMGGKILSAIQNATDKIPVRLSLDFAGDSLMCEWCYVVDFDANTFEVFEGFNKTGLSEDERFYRIPTEMNGYYQVKHVATWNLDSLPTDEEFLKRFKVEETDEPVEVGAA